MDTKDILREFGKGCSNTVNGNPADCEECLDAAARNILPKWQPIETAHKSERLLVSYINDSGYREVGIGLWWIGDEWTVSCEEATVTPTHWMHLPDPPT